MRNRRETLTTIRRPHGPGVVLARRYPGDDHLRALAIEHWQQASDSPRQRRDPGIDLPISTREQTAYQTTLPPDLRAALNGWIQPGVQLRRAREHERSQSFSPTLSALDATPAARRRLGISSRQRR